MLFLKRFAIAFAALYLCDVSVANSQQRWTLQQCIEHALTNNITVKQSAITAERGQIDMDQAKLNFLPSLNASASYAYNYGRTLDPTTYEFTTNEIQSANTSFNGNILLFNGLQLQHTLKQSKYEYMAGQEDLKRVQNDISLNVTTYYLQVLYNKEALKLANDRVEAAKQTRDRTKALVDAGTLAQGNLYDAEATLAAEELNAVNTENAVRSSLIDLAQLLELKYDPSFDIEEPKVDLPDQSSAAQTADQIYGTALGIMPEVKSGEYRLRSAESGLSVARGARYPRLSLFANYGSSYSNANEELTNSAFTGFGATPYVTSGGDVVLTPTFANSYEDIEFLDQIDQNRNHAFGFSLSVPIFNGWSANKNVQRAKLGIESYKYTDQDTRNRLYKSIVQAHNDAAAALKRYYAAEKSVTANDEAFTYATKRYDLGMMSSVDYLIARNNKARADSELIQAKYQLIFSIKLLDFYLGKPLTN
jgi:outer membrane protein